MSRPSTRFQQHQHQLQKYNQGVQQILWERQKRRQPNTHPTEPQSLGFEDPVMTLWKWVFKKLLK